MTARPPGFSDSGTPNGVVCRWHNADGSFTYTPERPSFNGTDSFTYTICDGDGMPIPTQCRDGDDHRGRVNDPPVANQRQLLQCQRRHDADAVRPGVLANDTDLDGDA